MCKTVEPVVFALETEAPSVSLTTGAAFKGETTLPSVSCEGLAGVALGPVVTAAFGLEQPVHVRDPAVDRHQSAQLKLRRAACSRRSAPAVPNDYRAARRGRILRESVDDARSSAHTSRTRRAGMRSRGRFRHGVCEPGVGAPACSVSPGAWDDDDRRTRVKRASSPTTGTATTTRASTATVIRAISRQEHCRIPARALRGAIRCLRADDRGRSGKRVRAQHADRRQARIRIGAADRTRHLR